MFLYSSFYSIYLLNYCIFKLALLHLNNVFDQKQNATNISENGLEMCLRLRCYYFLLEINIDYDKFFNLLCKSTKLEFNLPTNQINIR